MTSGLPTAGRQMTALLLTVLFDLLIPQMAVIDPLLAN
jgi:hypothetical protein